MAITPPATHPRRRRTRAQARAEILEAARTLLAEVPAHEATVVAIMARTTLSRKSFYVYFRDRAELLTTLVSPLRANADATLRAWRESEDAVASGRAALEGAAAVYHEHGQLLRALADAADRDAEAGAVWRSLIDPVIAVGVLKIESATAAGESSGLDPHGTARALVNMNVAHFFDQLAGKPDADVDTVIDTLMTIWQRTIYNVAGSPPSLERT